jgi:hypothetical protein
MTEVDQREFSRIRLMRAIKATREGSLLENCQLRDISMGNAFFSVPKATSVALSDVLDLELEIITSERPLHIEAKAEVVRLDRHGVAVRFVEMDLESLNDLYSLILMYHESQNIVRAEFFGKRSQSCCATSYV